MGYNPLTGSIVEECFLAHGRFPALLVMLAALAGAGGCEDSISGPCGGGCPPGKICDFDTGRCVDPRPPDCPADLGRYLSLAVDSTGRTVFSSYTAGYGDLVVGWLRADGAMNCEYLDGLDGDVGLYTSLALDPLDRPRVAYFDRSRGRLKYAQKGAAGWEVMSIPQTGAETHVVGRACSLALDSKGLPHIAFFDETAGALKVARKSSQGRWAVELVTAEGKDGDWPETLGGEVGRAISIVLDARDREWIAFQDLHSASLKAASRQPDGWAILEVDGGGDAGSWISAALDREGNMALAYHHHGEGALKYAWNQGGSLRRAVVDGGEVQAANGAQLGYPMGQHCALAFGHDGLPRIVYLDGAELALKLATGLPQGGFGQPDVLSAEGMVGFFNALALGSEALHGGSCRLGRDGAGALQAELVHFRIKAGFAGAIR